MRYTCSHCHTSLDAEPEDEHKVCPNCKAEAGIEPVKSETPPAMRYFGAILLVIGVVTVFGSLAGVVD